MTSHKKSLSETPSGEAYSMSKGNFDREFQQRCCRAGFENSKWYACDVRDP